MVAGNKQLGLLGAHMESRIPVPTDNIFKFYALFSLLLFVFSVGASIYVTKASNDEILNIAPELIRLENISHPSNLNDENRKLLEKKLKVTISDREAFTLALAVLSGLSVLGAAYGFRQWHKVVQPMQDRLLQLQIELAELQVQAERLKYSQPEN